MGDAFSVPFILSCFALYLQDYSRHQQDRPIPLVFLLFEKAMRRTEGAYSIGTLVWYYGQRGERLFGDGRL